MNARQETGIIRLHLALMETNAEAHSQVLVGSQ